MNKRRGVTTGKRAPKQKTPVQEKRIFGGGGVKKSRPRGKRQLRQGDGHSRSKKRREEKNLSKRREVPDTRERFKEQKR